MIGVSFKAMRRNLLWITAMVVLVGVPVAVIVGGRPADADAAPRGGIYLPPKATGKWGRVKTTGYCACGDCCSWRRSWFGFGAPVISKGPNRGQPKVVGQTASGAMARPGTIAADPSIFPFGTMFYIPGYGYGRVEDTGGDIKGYHLDLYFREHQTALNWGVRIKEVRFWRPDHLKAVKEGRDEAPPSAR